MTLNINKEQQNDENYRYKMSEVVLKFEGQGNGQRTVFLNIENISRELKRDKDSIICFLVTSLGCKCIENKEKQIVLYGTHIKETVQSAIYDYINNFVLCYTCKNPETDFVAEKKEIVLKCCACSTISQIRINKNNLKVINGIYTKIREQEKKNKKINKENLSV